MIPLTTRSFLAESPQSTCLILVYNTLVSKWEWQNDKSRPSSRPAVRVRAQRAMHGLHALICFSML